MNEGLLNLILALKNLCFNIVAVLTVLVALGNELKRLRIGYAWLEERHLVIQRAWRISLGVFLGLSALYSGLAHKPAPLLIDVVTVAVMVGVVAWLRRRGGGPAAPVARERFGDEEEPPRRRSNARRTRVEAPVEPPRRVRRERRTRPRTDEPPDEPDR